MDDQKIQINGALSHYQIIDVFAIKVFYVFVAAVSVMLLKFIVVYVLFLSSMPNDIVDDAFCWLKINRFATSMKLCVFFCRGQRDL